MLCRRLKVSSMSMLLFVVGTILNSVGLDFILLQCHLARSVRRSLLDAPRCLQKRKANRVCALVRADEEPRRGYIGLEACCRSVARSSRIRDLPCVLTHLPQAFILVAKAAVSHLEHDQRRRTVSVIGELELRAGGALVSCFAKLMVSPPAVRETPEHVGDTVGNA